MKRRILGSAGLGLAAALLVAGCSAGQITQTASQQAAVNGATEQAGTIAVRDAELAYPEGEDHVHHTGDDVDVLMTIANAGGAADELVSATSPDAESVTITGKQTVPAGYALVVSPDEPEVEKAQHAELLLEGLKRDLRIGQSASIVLTFAKAGKVTVELPVHVPAEEPRVVTEQEAEGESHGGGH